ncbi:MAG: glutaredoxin family protein [Nitriliruptoraceae bacterium]|nr:glutaredoxin family protein [Nitriliruptoraceae bacterium]
MVGSDRLRAWGLGLLLALVAMVLLPGVAAADPVTVLYFGADGCPYCALMEEDLDALEARHPGAFEVERFEVGGDEAARDRWVAELTLRGHEASGVPTLVIGDEVVVGYDPAIVDALAAMLPSQTAPPPGALDPPSSGVLRLPAIGQVDPGERSAIGATVLIALVDGFNPCSLWVLSVLLAMVLHAGVSRARVALIGGVFLTVTGLLYGAFIAGVFSVLGFIEHLGAIRVGVAVVALTVGLINVKDYLWFKRGVSLTIPDRFKPRIYRTSRSIRRSDRSLPAVLGTTVAMAAGIALVELPCTAGFPVVWSGIMHQQGVEGAEFVGLLALYLGIYVFDELVLFLAVVATLRIARFQERHGRLLKLLSGAVMLSLGVVLLSAPNLMEDPLAAAAVVLGSVLAAVLVDRVAQRRHRTGPGQGVSSSVSSDRRDDEVAASSVPSASPVSGSSPP